jgi:predicted MFS family arabinose efflux permease
VFRPAARALTPTVVGTGEGLAEANSLTAFSGSVIRLTAPPLGAVLLAGPGISFVLVVDIVSYLVSAVLIASVSRRLTPRAAPTEERGALHGLRYLRQSKILRGVLAGNGVFLTANAGLTALLVPLTVERLHAPGYAIGYLICGLGAGYLLGAAISAKAQTWLGVRDLLITTQVATAAAFFALVNAKSLTWAIVAAVLIGLPGSVLLITAETTIQRVTPAGMLARIGALFYAMDSLSVILGALIAPALIKLAGLPAALDLLAASALAAAPITFFAVPAHPAALTRPKEIPH